MVLSSSGGSRSRTWFAAALFAAAPLAAAPPPDQAPVRLNSLGFQPQSSKRAIHPTSSKRPLAWTLVDAQGAVRARGRTIPFGNDVYSGERVHQIDFSSFAAPGTGYRIVVGRVTSRPFAIADQPYVRLPEAALAYFYHNRSGIEIEARFAGAEQWARPAAHAPEAVTCFSGADEHKNEWPGCAYTLDASRGWYDAGDHGKYVVNGGIAVWTLMNFYERQVQRGETSLFRDGTAAIPESGNGVSDLLDEARWEMEFLLAMQVPETTRLSLVVGTSRAGPGLAFSEIDASGMAHHKLADRKWTSLPLAPHRDSEPRFLYPPSTAATLNLAATAAQCSRIWRDIDPSFALRCLRAAERAYAAASRNPSVLAMNNFTGSGSYGDAKLDDEFYWAAAELFAATGKQDYEKAVRASPHFTAQLTTHAWPQTAALGTLTLAMLPSGLPDADRERLRKMVIAAAEGFLSESAKVGYHIPFAPAAYSWGSNSDVLNRAMILGYAHDFTGDSKYRNGMVDAIDYLLGRNPLDRSFVSGFGARPMANPHHRFWAHSLDPAYPPPPPGALSGGPNNTNMSDEVARPLMGSCAPQTCWRDDIRAFSLNEVAVNWNAPLVWVAGHLAEPGNPQGQ
jgi:endoglucanase